MTIPMLDQALIYPTMKPVCEGQITDEQVKKCTSWIIKKETKYVPKSPKTSGGMYRGIETDRQLPRKGQGNLFNGFETPL